MLVKIHDSDNNEKMDRKDAYKAPNGFYYSSKAAYDQLVDREQKRKKCIDFMYELLGYDDFMKMPTIFYKKLNEWSPYGYDVIYAAMVLTETDIRNSIRQKTFKDEYCKTIYASMIIENHLNDAYKIAEHNAKTNISTANIETDDVDSIGIHYKASNSVAGLLGEV